MRKREAAAGASVLRRAIELMNDAGKHWTQRKRKRPMVFQTGLVGEWSEEPTYCSIGGIEEALGILPGLAHVSGGGEKIGLYPPRGIAALVGLGKALGLTRRPDDTDLTYASRAQGHIVHFNDADSRTWDEVRAKFEQGISYLEGAS